MIYPTIPREEFAERCGKVQNILKENGLDLILLYSDDRLTYGNAYGRYFADLQTNFENTLIAFMPGKNPVLLVGPETIGYAFERSAIRDMIVISEFASEEEDYPFTTVTPLKSVICDLFGREPEKIGLAPLVHMSATLLDTIKSNFSSAEFISIDKEVDALRAVKSKSEIEVIKYAYFLANKAMDEALRILKPGVTEREIAAEAEYASRKLGGECYGIDPIVASGSNAFHILGRTTTRKIEKDDIVVLTFAPRYEGYHGACGRTVTVGNPDAEAVTAIEAAVKAQEACAENLLPGRIGSEVEAIGRKIMAEAGYGDNFLYSGLHSVGVIEFEPPILGPSSSTVIQENMVISIDIPLFEHKIARARIEDGYLITKNGNERLTTPERIIRI